MNWKTGRKVKCSHCGKEFTAIPKGRGKVNTNFCSKKCAVNSRFKPIAKVIRR